MQHVAVAASRRQAEGGKASEKCATSSTVILNGIVKLLEGQRCFADEFGLPYDRVFDEECQVFRNKKAEGVMRSWLQDKVEGPTKFTRLVNDLVQHNLALCAALDGVALESISRLGPSAVKSKSFSIFGWRPFAWITFRRLHKIFASNDYLRHQELVVKGFAKSYCAHRETLRNQNLPLSTSQADKEKS